MGLSVIRVYSKLFESGMSEYKQNDSAKSTGLHYKVLKRLIPGYPDNMTPYDEIIQKIYVKTRQPEKVFNDWYRNSKIS